MYVIINPFRMIYSVIYHKRLQNLPDFGLFLKKLQARRNRNPNDRQVFDLWIKIRPIRDHKKIIKFGAFVLD